MPRFSPARGALLAFGVLLGCSDPICGCSPVEPQAAVIVTGLVLDAATMAVPGAEVRLVGEIRIDCITNGYWRYAIPDPAIADGAGRFTLRIETLGLAGTYCVDLTARDPGTGSADTLYATPAPFRDAPPLDTIDVQFLIP